jgi:hypothetical protein
MITNTCLTGGSFDVAPVDGDLEEPRPAPFELGAEPRSLAAVFVGAGDDEERFVGAGVWVAVSAGVGVGVDSDTAAGGSPADVGDAAEIALATGRISFSRGRADADVSSTRDPVTSPMITPKPRKTSTSSTHTRGEGRVRPRLTSIASTRLMLERQRRRPG